jgi:hypothetical protein
MGLVVPLADHTRYFHHASARLRVDVVGLLWCADMPLLVYQGLFGLLNRQLLAIFYNAQPNNYCPNKDRSSLLSHLLRQNDARLSHSSRRPR